MVIIIAIIFTIITICAFVTINQDKIVFADTETVINDSDKIKSKADKIAELNEKYLLNYIEDDNYIEEIGRASCRERV